MPMTCENDVKREIKKLLDRYGCYHHPYPAGPRGVIGPPDRHACCRGWFIGIEAKYGRNWLSPKQSEDLKAIVKAGGIALVINEERLGLLDNVLKAIVDDHPTGYWWDLLPQHDAGYLEPKK